MKNIINGKNIIICLNGEAVAAAKSCEISVDTDLEEVASSNSANAKDYRVGRYGWSVSVSSLVANVGMVLNSGKIATMTCVDSRNTGKTLLSGTVICTKAKITASVGTLSVGSYSFIGTGELYGDD